MEEIKKELRSFAEFYGCDCWQNGRQGIRELPNGDKFINIYADKIAKILSKHIVSGRSEQLAIDALKLISTAHSEGWSRDIAKDALKEIANCH